MEVGIHVTYRHPGLLAKTVTTLDVLSQGRSTFGIGAAWYEREHLALGVPYPPVRERFEMLEETLQICQQMWSDNDGPYDGTHKLDVLKRHCDTVGRDFSEIRKMPRIAEIC